MAIVNEMCMEFGKNTSFYFVCKFIYHTTFFRNKILKNIPLYDEPSFFVIFFFVRIYSLSLLYVSKHQKKVKINCNDAILHSNLSGSS